jgi:conjugative relaxase-like TrwC/TraI family protein
MLRITPSVSAAQAQSYYATSDYYLSDHELPGTWEGKGASRLGLTGKIDREDWDALCENRHPQTGKRLTPRTKTDRRVLYDFTFSAPKSVSLLYAFTQNEKLLDAFRTSVEETMQDIEAEMKTRVRSGGANDDRLTGEAVRGSFVHLTARPENGVPDPHLHSHECCFNVTWDGEEKRWKAAQFGDIKRDGAYFEGMFHMRLAERLERLGLPLARTREGYEIAGIERATLRKFSRRTERIEKLAAELGITDAVEKDKLGAKTRNRKADNLSLGQLTDLWRSRLSPEESARLRDLADELDGGRDVFVDDRKAAKEAVAAYLGEFGGHEPCLALQ